MVLCHLRRFLSTSKPYDRLLLLASLESKMATKYFSSTSDSKQNLKDMAKFKPVTHVIFDMDGLLLDTEVLYEEIHGMICREFEKDLNLDLRMDIQGRFRRDVAQLIIDELNLPITVDEYECRLLSFYKEIFPKSKLKPDTEIIYKRMISELAESYGKKYTRDVQLKVLGTTEQATASIVIQECGLPISVKEFLDDFHKRQKTSLDNANLMEGAERLVRHLYNHKVPIAIATSSGKDAVALKTQKHKELFSLFHHTVMGSSDPDVKNGKPAPDIFEVCARRFDEKPSFDKCLVFEDAPNGVTGAVAAGMQTVMVPDPELPRDRTSHATQVLNSLLEFKPEEFGLPAF